MFTLWEAKLDALRMSGKSKVIQIGNSVVILGLYTRYFFCADMKVWIQEKLQIKIELIYIASNGLYRLFLNKTNT